MPFACHCLFSLPADMLICRHTLLLRLLILRYRYFIIPPCLIAAAIR